MSDTLMLPDNRIRAIVVQATEERRIVTGLIVSTEFSKAIVPKLYLEYFNNMYLRKVAEWCTEYFNKYAKAPALHIQDIYDDKKRELDSTGSELISTLLSSLSDQYEDGSLNVEYMVECAINYFRKRELEIHQNNVTVLLQDNKIAEAEQEVARFQLVALNIDESLYIDPGNQEQRKELYEKYETKQKDFFKMPGDLGEFIGNIKQGDVIGIVARQKIGKTVSGDSLVYMADGSTKTIKEVVENELTDVLCFDEKDMHIKKGIVSDWIHSGVKKEYKITLKNGSSIKTAITHPFYTPNGWKPLGDIKVGDYVAIAKNISVGQGTQPEYIVKALAYLIADGHIGLKQISFTKYDTEVRTDFVSGLKSMRNKYRETDKVVFVHQGPVIDLLNKVGLLDSRSGNKFIPECIMQADNSTVALFLRTLFTCDGSIWLTAMHSKRVFHKPEIKYSSKSWRLIQDIDACLRRFGLIFRHRTKVVGGTPYYILSAASGKTVCRFIEKIGFLSSKQKKAEEWIDLCREERDYISVIPYKFIKELMDKGVVVKDNSSLRNTLHNKDHMSTHMFKRLFGDSKILHTDVAWVRVQNIEETGAHVDMYDLTVDKYHSFIANGIILHNSHLLNDFFKHLILQKRKTLKFAIEMTDVEEITRFDKLFFPSVDKEAGEYRFPCFDCLQNQNGECQDRESSVIVRQYGAPDYEFNKDHVPCTKCRYTDPDRFMVCTYEQTITRQQLEGARVIKEMYKYKDMLSKYARIVVRPKYTLSYDLMMYDIDMMYKKYEFMPQAILIDYIDIMKTNSQFADYRVDDEKWKMMQQLASATKCAVITPTQANRAGIESATLKQTDQGGFYGKGRHVNLMLGVNQTAQEKRDGLYRINILDGRSVRTNEEDFCFVLQDLKSGQMHLDSYWPNQEYRF